MAQESPVVFASYKLLRGPFHNDVVKLPDNITATVQINERGYSGKYLALNKSTPYLLTWVDNQYIEDFTYAYS